MAQRVKGITMVSPMYGDIFFILIFDYKFNSNTIFSFYIFLYTNRNKKNKNQEERSLLIKI